MGILKRFNVLVSVFTCIFGASLLITAPSASAASIFSGSKKEACKGANLSNSSSINENCDADAQRDTGLLIRRIVNLFTIVVGVAAVIMIIVSGFRFITAGGDANNVTAARNGLLYAVIGLVIVAFAQAIARFVLTKTT